MCRQQILNCCLESSQLAEPVSLLLVPASNTFACYPARRSQQSFGQSCEMNDAEWDGVNLDIPQQHTPFSIAACWWSDAPPPNSIVTPSTMSYTILEMNLRLQDNYWHFPFKLIQPEYIHYLSQPHTFNQSDDKLFLCFRNGLVVSFLL
jgi:hypothetical protein